MYWIICIKYCLNQISFSKFKVKSLLFPCNKEKWVLYRVQCLTVCLWYSHKYIFRRYFSPGLSLASPRLGPKHQCDGNLVSSARALEKRLISSRGPQYWKNFNQRRWWCIAIGLTFFLIRAFKESRLILNVKIMRKCACSNQKIYWFPDYVLNRNLVTSFTLILIKIMIILNLWMSNSGLTSHQYIHHTLKEINSQTNT